MSNKWASPQRATEGELPARPAGRPSGDSGDTIWGSIKVPSGGQPNGHVGLGVRPELRKAFADAATLPEAEEPTYALGMRSSVAFGAGDGPSGAPFVEQAYRRHLGVEASTKGRNNSGPVAMVTDRAPDTGLERRRRRALHGLLLGAGSEAPSKAFNRKKLAGSLAEYGEERITLNRLIGDTHKVATVVNFVACCCLG